MKRLKINLNSIQSKLNLVIILLTSLILFCFGVYDYLALKGKMTTELNEMTEAGSGRWAAGRAIAWWDFNQDLGRQGIMSEMKEKRV